MITDDTGARPVLESPVPASVRRVAFELDQIVSESSYRLPEMLLDALTRVQSEVDSLKSADRGAALHAY